MTRLTLLTILVASFGAACTDEPTSDETPDKQGRVTIPPMLRDYASLSKDCIVIGAMNRVEIWDAASWQSYSDEQEQAFADLSEDLFPGL